MLESFGLRAPAALCGAPGQLQCGAQEFSQTEANFADSICKLRRSVLGHVAYATPPPSAVRQGS